MARVERASDDPAVLRELRLRNKKREEEKNRAEENRRAEESIAVEDLIELEAEESDVELEPAPAPSPCKDSEKRTVLPILNERRAIHIALLYKRKGN